jgi:hypothetical protein
MQKEDMSMDSQGEITTHFPLYKIITLYVITSTIMLIWKNFVIFFFRKDKKEETPTIMEIN